MDGSRRRGPLGDPVVLLAAAVSVLVRAVMAARPLGADEAGYLAVGQQWVSGGPSLYSGYWVDRPPLLVGLFRLAAIAGGAVPLRLLGCLAVWVTVLAVARGAFTVSGPTAARTGAVAAGFLLVSPTVGALEVDGELLAAPFVAVALTAALEALGEVPRRRAVAWGLMSGSSAMAAVLVKQNMLDGFVFVVAVSLALRAAGHRRFAPRVRWLLSGTACGALLAAGVVAAWTQAHGTSVPQVLWAMYPFRLEAARAIAAHPSTAALARITVLLAGACLSGLVLLSATAVAAAVRRRPGPVGGPPPRVATAALLAVVAYDVVSIALGGNSWLHYLVEPVAPLALAVAVAVPSLPVTTRAVTGVVVASSVLAVGTAALRPHGSLGDRLGAAIGAVSRPGDSIVTAFGHAQVTESSGLRSPYPYLWSLPAHVLDPHLRLLDRVLAGPSAPTWFVAYSRPGPRLPAAGTALELDRRYHQVADVSGHVVYLRDGVHRAAPRLRS